MSQKPTSNHVVRYTRPDAAGRLHSEICLRNGPPLIAALSPWLTGAAGPALEFGSGTGQHAANLGLAFPALRLHASDPDPAHRRSAAAWAESLRLPARPVFDLDARDDWAARREIAALGPLAAILAVNVIHIAPIGAAQGIVAGAGRVLAPGGFLIFYGPFDVDGMPMGAGNAAFDVQLRAENPEWGLRRVSQVDAMATEAALSRAALIAMPAGNQLLIFRRSGEPRQDGPIPRRRP